MGKCLVWLRVAWVLGVIFIGSWARADPAPPPLQLGGETREIRIAAPSAQLAQRFVLIPVAGSSLDVAAIRVDLSDGTKRLWPLGCTLDHRPCDQAPSPAPATKPTSATLELTAQLPALGTYSGTLVVVDSTGKTISTFTLTVDRALDPLGLVALGGATKLGRYCPIGCASEVDLWFTL